MGDVRLANLAFEFGPYFRLEDVTRRGSRVGLAMPVSENDPKVAGIGVGIPDCGKEETSAVDPDGKAGIVAAVMLAIGSSSEITKLRMEKL